LSVPSVICLPSMAGLQQMGSKRLSRVWPLNCHLGSWKKNLVFAVSTIFAAECRVYLYQAGESVRECDVSWQTIPVVAVSKSFFYFLLNRGGFCWFLWLLAAGWKFLNYWYLFIELDMLWHLHKISITHNNTLKASCMMHI
jgi:hypothetical protein